MARFQLPARQELDARTGLHQPGRRAATYDYDAAMTEEHARDWLQRAEGFVAAIEEYLKREPQ